jgi:hypothetical protein
MRPHPTGQRKSIHRSWQLDIGEYEIDELTALKNRHRLRTISGFYDAIPAPAKVVRHVEADEDLVFDD